MTWWRSEEKARAEQLVNAVIRAASDVRRELGGRFTPAVYRAALRYELEQRALRVAELPSLFVKYQGRVVGEFQPDLLVDDQLLVELDSAPALGSRRVEDAHRALHAARMPRALVLNFGAPRLEYRRLARAA